MDDYTPLPRPSASNARPPSRPAFQQRPQPPPAARSQSRARSRSRPRQSLPPARRSASVHQTFKKRKQRGFDCNANDWDDTALIRAWDTAKSAHTRYLKGEINSAEFDLSIQPDHHYNNYSSNHYNNYYNNHNNNNHYNNNNHNNSNQRRDYHDYDSQMHRGRATDRKLQYDEQGEEQNEEGVLPDIPRDTQDAFQKACAAWYWSGYHTGVYKTMLKLEQQQQQPSSSKKPRSSESEYNKSAPIPPQLLRRPPPQDDIESPILSTLLSRPLPTPEVHKESSNELPKKQSTESHEDQPDHMEQAELVDDREEGEEPDPHKITDNTHQEKQQQQDAQIQDQGEQKDQDDSTMSDQPAPFIQLALQKKPTIEIWLD